MLSLHIGVPARSMPMPVADFERDVLRALALAGFRGAMSLAVVSDAEMRRVNRDFHATDSATDVLAFPLVPGAQAAGAGSGAPGGFDAEVIVSVDTARREARARGVTPAAELMLYVVHGTLHLLGHDDHDPAKAAVMHRRTLAILAKIGHPNTIEIPGLKKQGSSK